MPSFNKVMLIGNLTRDPQLKHVGASETALCELGLAVNERRKGADEQWGEETLFVNVTLWAQQAEIANQYLSKGSPILVEGRLRMEEWKSEGRHMSRLKVVGTRMEMLGGKQQPQRDSEYEETAAEKPPEEKSLVNQSNDIPF